MNRLNMCRLSSTTHTRYSCTFLNMSLSLCLTPANYCLAIFALVGISVLEAMAVSFLLSFEVQVKRDPPPSKNCKADSQLQITNSKGERLDNTQDVINPQNMGALSTVVLAAHAVYSVKYSAHGGHSYLLRPAFCCSTVRSAELVTRNVKLQQQLYMDDLSH